VVGLTRSFNGCAKAGPRGRSAWQGSSVGWSVRLIIVRSGVRAPLLLMEARRCKGFRPCVAFAFSVPKSNPSQNRSINRLCRVPRADPHALLTLQGSRESGVRRGDPSGRGDRRPHDPFAPNAFARVCRPSPSSAGPCGSFQTDRVGVGAITGAAVRGIGACRALRSLGLRRPAQTLTRCGRLNRRYSRKSMSPASYILLDTLPQPHASWASGWVRRIRDEPAVRRRLHAAWLQRPPCSGNGKRR
jgi:hypothetical protein